MRTPEGTKIVDILNLLPKAGLGGTVKMNVAEEGGVKIHSITFPKDKHPTWNNFVGADSMYVGSSKDAVWAAAGEGALDALKAAIKKTGQPAAAGAEKAPWGELIVRLKPWVEQFIAAAPQSKRGDDSYRKMAQAAFHADDDQLLVRMTHNENGVRGEITIQSGILRFAGKAAADFSKNNLDTPQKGGGGPGKKSAGTK
jgi:hypothetical protein